jgi:hypothetical protein
MTDDTLLPFDLPAVRRKKLTVDFDGGSQSSDAGLLLLREAERKLGVCRRLAEAMLDRRDPDRIQHAMFEMVMARASAIACGHKDAIDLDRLRHDPLMKVAVGRCGGVRSICPCSGQYRILEHAVRYRGAAYAPHRGGNGPAGSGISLERPRPASSHDTATHADRAQPRLRLFLSRLLEPTSYEALGASHRAHRHRRTGRHLPKPEELAQEFEPTAQSIRNWVGQAECEAGCRGDGLATAEREELNRLRRENRQLRLERDILSNRRGSGPPVV